MTMGRTAAKQGRDPIVLLHFHATVCKVPQQTNSTYHYHILSFLCSKIMLCKRCKQGVKQAFHTQETAYLSHSWRYSQILPWHTKSTFIIKVFLIKCHELPCFAKFYIPSPKDNFLHNVSHYAKQSKMRQNALVSSSQKVVNYKQAGCKLFNNIIDKRGANITACIRLPC